MVDLWLFVGFSSGQVPLFLFKYVRPARVSALEVFNKGRWQKWTMAVFLFGYFLPTSLVA
jgi:hypothetical protein